MANAALTTPVLKPGKTIAELNGRRLLRVRQQHRFTAQCWGSNDSGQLGIGNSANVGANPGDMGSGLIDLDLGT